MSKNFRNAWATGAGLAALLATGTASACGNSCSAPQGLLDYLFRPSAACSPCAVALAEAPVVERRTSSYQGDYMVQQWASYSGPALIAPRPTYAPTPTASGYPYVSAQNEYGVEPYSDPGESDYQSSAPVRPAARLRQVVRHAAIVRHSAVKRRIVHVRSDLPPKKGVQIVHARAEVRIYGPKRMDIRLYKN